MKYYGKEKCKILKQIRAEIAKNNDIEWVIDECQHKGNCLGTCPKCEAEVRELERKLEERKTLGKAVAVAGIAAGIALSVSGCMNAPLSVPGEPLPPETSANTTAAPETQTETETETTTETTAETTAETTSELETAELAGEPVEWVEEGEIYEPTAGVPVIDFEEEPEDEPDKLTEEDYALMGKPMAPQSESK